MSVTVTANQKTADQLQLDLNRIVDLVESECSPQRNCSWPYLRRLPFPAAAWSTL